MRKELTWRGFPQRYEKEGVYNQQKHAHNLVLSIERSQFSAKIIKLRSQTMSLTF